LRIAQQIIGEVEPGTGDRLAVRIQFAREQAAEAERTARLRVIQAVLLQAPVEKPEGQVVLAPDDVSDVVGEIACLVAV
jgi:hypothetical protein